LDQRTLRALEFDKVVAMLTAHASFSAGSALCARLEPLDDLESAQAAQAETAEALACLRLSQSPPFGGVTDVREAAQRAHIGVMLDPHDLLQVADLIGGSRKIKKFLGDLSPDYPVLRGLGSQIVVAADVEKRVRDAISDSAEIRDDASPELLRIRRAHRIAQSRIRDRLEGLIRSSEALRFLQEPIITVRNGRFVVPVKAEFKSAVPGIVHDQSHSGATLFIEPMASVEANNEVRRLELEERDEIERILLRLSAIVGASRDDIALTVKMIARVDFAFAKARLSAAMNGVEPRLGDDFKIDVRQARHPLLKGDVVPVDVRLGQDFDTLVITGPNTGGKTVTLKTTGLLTLMGQAGLHVPASSASRLSVFNQVFCDIGDEQSIEQSLSTFSSHMRNIVRIVNEAGEGSLVLLDEIGAGTDPEEGSRLAMSLLEHLHAAGCKTVATTHYSELKSFAYLTDRVENASVEFDVESLRPTFKLSIGLPGRSNAFEIASRLGLDRRIIDRARAMLSDEHLQVEHLIGEIQASKFQADEEKRKAFLTSLKAQELESEYDSRLRQLKAREKEILDRARQESSSLVARVRAECDEALRKVRSAASNPRLYQSLQGEVRDVLRRARAEADIPEEPQRPRDAVEPGGLVPGMMVHVNSVRQDGEVLAPPDQNGNVQIRVGIIRTQVHKSDLSQSDSGDKAQAREQVTRLMSEKAQTASPELMLLGLTSEEAVAALDKYLDDAVLGGLKQVRIVHGKGTGVLRKAVQEALKTSRNVVSFRLGSPAEGGDGVTIAILTG
jgi:DNA mismatch repair protein MutS2